MLPINSRVQLSGLYFANHPHSIRRQKTYTGTIVYEHWFPVIRWDHSPDSLDVSLQFKDIQLLPQGIDQLWL